MTSWTICTCQSASSPNSGSFSQRLVVSILKTQTTYRITRNVRYSWFCSTCNGLLIFEHWNIGNIDSVLWMGGEGHSVPRYLVSRNRRYKDNERLILQEANIASCRVIFSLLDLVEEALWFGITFNGARRKWRWRLADWWRDHAWWI
jgi:hypothetical protein